MKITYTLVGAAGGVAFGSGAFIVGYELATRLGILFVLFTSAAGLSVVIASLGRAPEGYEDRNGFHLQRRQRSRARRNHSFSYAIRELRTDFSHPLPNS